MADTLTARGWDPNEEIERKRIALERLAVIEGLWKYLVRQRIALVFEDPDTRERVQRYCSTSLNVARAVMVPLSNAYNVPPRRYVRASDEAVAKAFADLVKQSRIRKLAPWWNLVANYVGLVAVAPVVHEQEDGRETLVLEHYYPHQLDFQWGGAGVHGDPTQALVTLYKHQGVPPEKRIGGFADAYSSSYSYGSAFLRNDVLGYVSVDSEHWEYWDASGNPSPELAAQAGVADGSAFVKHDLGFLPVTIFRTREGVLDWWSCMHTQGLHDATLEAALVNACMNWVRKSQNRRLAAYGFTDEAQDNTVTGPDLQVQDPEVGIQLKPTETLNVFSLDTPPAAFLEHLRFIIDQQADLFGIPPSDVSFDANGSDLAVSVRTTKLTANRAQQLPYFQDAEDDLWDKAWRVTARSGHGDADVFAANDDDRERIEIEFPELNLIDDPERREAVYKQRVARGGTNAISQIQLENPALTFEEARERFEENIAITARTNEQLARIGGATSMQASRFDQQEGVQSQAQDDGREGGQDSSVSEDDAT